MDPRRAAHRLANAARPLAPAAIPFVLAVVLFAPATVGGKVLAASDLPLFHAPFPPQPGMEPQNEIQFDSANVFEPDGLQVRSALREGRLPVWTPWISTGRPLLAAQQSAPLFPLTWIGVVFPYWESLAWIAVLKLTLAALGTFLLARTLGLGRGPALIAGIAFGFGTYLVDWLQHPHANAYVILPWLFLLAERLCRTGAVRDGAALGGALGVAYLGGQPESSLLVSLATAGWFTYRLSAARPPRREAARRVTLAAGAAVLGCALAAIMILPLIEALRESSETSRAGPPLPVRVAASVFFPEFWGRPDRVEVPGPVNFTERTLYLGVLPTLLAGVGLVARRPRGPQLFFAGLAVVAVAVALDTGPLVDVAADLPLLDRINLSRSLVLASFAVAMLAAFGFERLLTGNAAERRRMLVAAGVAALLPVVVAFGANPSWLSDLGDGFRRLLGRDTPITADVVALASVLRWLILAIASLALVAALAAWRRRRVALVGGACALVAVDLLVMGWGYNPAITTEQAEPPTPRAAEVMRGLTAGGARVVGIDALEPNTASRWGLADARGHEQPAVERTTGLWYALGGGASASTEAVDPQNPRTPQLLDVFGVRAVLLDPSALRGSELVGVPPLRDDPIAFAGPGGVVVENPSALPPAFVTYRWRSSSGLSESLLLTAVRSSRQARDEPVIETSDPSPAGPPPAATPAHVVSRSDTSVTVEVRARARGQLVLLDAFYPGWRAEVDGRSTPIRPANGAFRAVAVGPGRHKVHFSYRPASVIAGGVISLVALGVLVVCLLLFRGKSVASARTDSARGSPDRRKSRAVPVASQD
jgi:Bacterial membrane protein YfhO